MQEDNETARWVRQGGELLYDLCSNCGYAKKAFYSWRYCPACGKRMEDKDG